MTELAFALTPAQRSAVVGRRATLQLSESQAAFLALAADPKDPLSIVRVLGLDITSLQPLAPRPWLDMAARTASVSYRDVLSSATLSTMLIEGRVLPAWSPHLGHLLAEAPLLLLVLAIEELACRQHVPIAMLWQNLGKLAEVTQSGRLVGWLALSFPGGA